jgi:hypothetical protein
MFVFFGGSFAVYDFDYGVIIIYGNYKIKDDNSIECAVINRYAIKNNNEHFDEFRTYYKTFLENDTFAFKLEYDPALYKNQSQLLCLTDNSRYKCHENILDDHYYKLNGVSVYKFNGGIKRTSAKLNVRDTPSLKGKILKTLEKGSIVRIDARTTFKDKIDGRLLVLHRLCNCRSVCFCIWFCFWRLFE